MPRVHLGAMLDDAPRSVAGVAAQLGVSPSTLRTWERRYGLAPSARTSGSHRRYSPLDVARLKHMRDLMERGYSACEAAERALAQDPTQLDIDMPVTVGIDSLVEAADQGEAARVRSIVDQAVAGLGLLRAWGRLIAPALKRIRDNPRVAPPGQAPATLVQRVVLGALERIVQDRSVRERCCDGSPRVVILADAPDAALAAHVLAAALCWQGVSSGVMAAPAECMGAALEHYLADAQPCAVLMVQPRSCHQELVAALEQHAQIPIYLIGRDTPCVLSPYVTRLHTLRAAVCEIGDLCQCGDD